MDLQLLLSIAQKYPAIKKMCEMIIRDHTHLMNERIGGSIEIRVSYEEAAGPVVVENMGREKHFYKVK